MDQICMLEEHCQQCGSIKIIQRKNNENLKIARKNGLKEVFEHTVDTIP